MPELIMVSGTIVTVVFTIERVISGITKSKLFLLPAPAGIFICTQHRCSRTRRAAVRALFRGGGGGLRCLFVRLLGVVLGYAHGLHDFFK